MYLKNFLCVLERLVGQQLDFLHCSNVFPFQAELYNIMVKSAVYGIIIIIIPK